MSEKDFAIKVLLLADKVGLLLGCIRNYKYAQMDVDLQGVLNLEPEVAEMLADVREDLHKELDYE